MKIGILGAGAVGCYIGGRLAATGHDVLFVARPRMKDELDTFGLNVAGIAGRDAFSVAKPNVSLDPAGLTGRDAVLVCVKSAQTPEVVTELVDHVGERAIVVSMQNGVRNAEVLREGFLAAGAERTVLGGIVGFNVVAAGKGVFRQGTSGALVIERSSVPGASALVRALADAGFEVEVPADIRGVQWSKLVMNLNNAVGALTDVPTPRLIFEAPYRRIVVAIVAEALRVLSAARIHPSRLGAIPVALFPYVLRLPTPLLKVVARAQLEMDPEARSSMWQDLDRRRLTEVDFLNGEIVRLAENARTRAPVNQRIVELVKAAERKNEGSPRLSAEALWDAMHR